MTVTTNPRTRSRTILEAARPPFPADEQWSPFRLTAHPEEARHLLKQRLARAVIADVLVARDAPDSREIRAAAASLLIPAEAQVGLGWVVGFGSAAWLHTGADPARPGPPAELQVIIPPGRRRPKGSGVRGRQVALAPAQVLFLGPVAVTDPVRTAADVARDVPAPEAIAALRRLGELCDVRPHDVLQVLATMRYARGAATARRVVRAWTEQG
jgi:hypothetical protein